MKKFFLLIVVAGISIFASDIDSKLQAANSLYQQKKYTEAVEAYKSMLGNSNASASIYYNMGNAYFKMGQFGYAVLYFERAHKLSPGDEDIRHNLQLAKSRTADRIDVVPQFFIFKWADSISSMYSADGWMKFAIIMSFMFAGLIIGFLLSGNMRAKRALLFTSTPFFVLLIFGVFMTIARYNAEKQRDYAVVTIPVTGIKNAPEEGSKDAFVVHEGLKVKIEDSVDKWYRVHLEDGKVGWVLKSHVELI
jgi:tetratricopeptide (TPR) repeat protein